MVRIGARDPAAAASLLIGSLWSATLAVSLGRLSGSAKLFSGGFLFFLYLWRPPAPRRPWTSRAGCAATDHVRLGYAIATVLLGVASTMGEEALRHPVAHTLPSALALAVAVEDRHLSDGVVLMGRWARRSAGNGGA